MTGAPSHGRPVAEANALGTLEAKGNSCAGSYAVTMPWNVAR